MYTQSYQICTQACADDKECVAASYTGGKEAGFCYLKGKNNGATTNDNVDGTYLSVYRQNFADDTSRFLGHNNTRITCCVFRQLNFQDAFGHFLSTIQQLRNVFLNHIYTNS